MMREGPCRMQDQFPLSVRTDAISSSGQILGTIWYPGTEGRADCFPVTLRNLEPQVKAKVLMVDKEEGISWTGDGENSECSP